MAAMIFNTRVKNKRDTNINLESTNPVLLNGEIVIIDHETEGIKLKIGDGITCYATTDYGIIIDTIGAMTIVTNKTPTYVHIVIVVNSSGNLTMYFNGIENIWTADSNSAITSNKTYIYNGQGIGRFIGAINTMRWWDTALTVTEIEELFSLDSSDYTL